MAENKISPSVIWTLPFFSDLNDQEKAELLKVASFKHLRRGEVLFMQGDPMTHSHWVCHGAIQLFRETPDGHELTDSVLITGDTLCDDNMIRSPKVHILSARALQESTLLSLPMTWISRHIDSGWNHLARRFIEFFAVQAQEARLDAEHQATMNATQLVACFLQKLCVRHHFDPRGFELPYSKTIIASCLNMELESLSRTFPKLREHGITVRGKYVSFDDVALAQHTACGICSSSETCNTYHAMQLLAASAASRQKEPTGS